MSVTSQDVANEALQMIGDNMPPVQGQAPNFDDSPAGVALQKLYAPAVATVARQFGWDFTRNTVALTLTGNTPADPSWSFEYAYPGNGVEIWQLIPATVADPNNPLPVNWAVGNTMVAGTQSKVVWTNQQNAKVTYNNNPSENTWDSLFREAVVRLLASELSMALFGRPDSAQSYLESSVAFGSIGEGRSD